VLGKPSAKRREAKFLRYRQPLLLLKESRKAPICEYCKGPVRVSSDSFCRDLVNKIWCHLQCLNKYRTEMAKAESKAKKYEA